MSWSSRRGASAATTSRPPVRTWHAWRRSVPALPAVVAVVLAARSAGPGGTTHALQPGGQPPPCSANPPPEAPPSPTTVTTIGQAYYCVLAHYYAGPVLDDRVLLAGAFAGFTQELDRLGMDRPDATMPALTGDRGRDWAAFAAVYEKVTDQLAASPAQPQVLAAATMTGMIASLHNNHARWSYPAPPPGDGPGDLGIMTSPAPPLADIAPQEALPPLFITAVESGSPAASSGLRPGDIIVSVDGAPPFPGGIITLVGTRTSGIVAAPAAPYLLDDASLIILPAKQELSADHELINGIGVAPDYYIPLTAQNLSTGHDPDIIKALTLLGGR
jgi:PDZ domain